MFASNHSEQAPQPDTRPRLGADAKKKLADIVYMQKLANAVSPPHKIGDFVDLKLLGKGGMGVVYKARQTNLDRDVAIKLLMGTKTGCQAAIDRFLNEQKILGMLDHPNIITVFDAGVHEEQPYVVMQLIDGFTLADWTMEHEGNLPIEAAARYMAQVSNAVEYAHNKGLLHRDIKPANIMVDSSDNAQLLDFGLAKIFAQESNDNDNAFSNGLTLEGQLMGTPHYMAPEQLKGSRQIDHRADVYSLAASLLFLLTKQVVYPNSKNLIEIAMNAATSQMPKLREIRPDIPEDLEDIITTCLQPDPNDRIQTAGEFAEHLETFSVGSLLASVSDKVGIALSCEDKQYRRILTKNSRDIEGKLLKSGAEVICHPEAPDKFLKFKPENWQRFKAIGFDWNNSEHF